MKAKTKLKQVSLENKKSPKSQSEAHACGDYKSADVDLIDAFREKLSQKLKWAQPWN